MTAVVGHGSGVTRFLIWTGASILILSPSFAVGMSLLDGKLPVQSALQLSYFILFLASVNLGTVIMLEPYRRYFSKLAPPALMGMVTVVLLFAIEQAFNRFVEHMGYGFLAPFVVACVALMYAAILVEKSIPLKCLLSLDSIALMFLWALGEADKFTMPF